MGDDNVCMYHLKQNDDDGVNQEYKVIRKSIKRIEGKRYNNVFFSHACIISRNLQKKLLKFENILLPERKKKNNERKTAETSRMRCLS